MELVYNNKIYEIEADRDCLLIWMLDNLPMKNIKENETELNYSLKEKSKAINGIDRLLLNYHSSMINGNYKHKKASSILERFECYNCKFYIEHSLTCSNNLYISCNKKRKQLIKLIESIENEYNFYTVENGYYKWNIDQDLFDTLLKLKIVVNRLNYKLKTFKNETSKQ